MTIKAIEEQSTLALALMAACVAPLMPKPVCAILGAALLVWYAVLCVCKARASKQAAPHQQPRRGHFHAALKEAATEQARDLFKACLFDAQQGAGQLPVKETQMLGQLLAAEHQLAQLIDEAPACPQSAPPSGES